MYSARIPWARQLQVTPLSSVTQTPPQETPSAIRRLFLGSTQIEWIPGNSAPPPNHSRRLGCSQSDRTRCQDVPPSSERNRPPGIVPHQSPPRSSSPPASSAHTRSTVQGIGLPPAGSTSWYPSGLGGKAGDSDSFQVAPPSSDRCSLA